MKVYLARSNAANPAVFSRVEQELKRFGHEVVTFNGGRYSPKPMLDCDAVVFVPPAQMLPDYGNGTCKLVDTNPNIGPGQWKQVAALAEDWLEEQADYEGDYCSISFETDSVMCVSRVTDKEVIVMPVTSLYKYEKEHDDYDSAVSVGYMGLDDDEAKLIQDVLGDNSVNQYVPFSNSDGCNYRLEGFTLTEGPMLAAAKLFGIL